MENCDGFYVLLENQSHRKADLTILTGFSLKEENYWSRMSVCLN